MAKAYAAIKLSLETAADAAKGLLQVMMGTIGAKVMYPATGKGRKSRDTGAVWLQLFLPTLLTHIGQYLDLFDGAHCGITTDVPGNPAHVDNQVGVSSVVKDSVLDTLTVNLTSAMANAGYIIVGHIIGVTGTLTVTWQGTTSFTVRFFDPAGVQINIDSQVVRLGCFGLR